MPPSTESMAVLTGPSTAGPRTVGWCVVTDWDGSISRTGENTCVVPELERSPLPLMTAVGVVPLEVEGPALRKPPAIELPITIGAAAFEIAALAIGEVVPITVMVPKLAKAPVEAAAVPELAQV